MSGETPLGFSPERLRLPAAVAGGSRTGESAAARRTAKAVRDFQAVFLMEMLKPLTEELSGGMADEESAAGGLGLSTGADVYSYFWAEALAQHLTGGLPGLPGMTEVDQTPGPAAAAGDRPGASRSLRDDPAGSSRPGRVPAIPLSPGPAREPAQRDRAQGSRSDAFGPPPAGPTSDRLSALASVRARAAATADATAAAAVAPAAPVRSGGAAGLPTEVQSLAGKAGRLFSLPENLVRAVVSVESGGRANATSDRGAVGLMQLMPGTAREMGVRNPRDAWDNLVGGVKYLARQLERFGRLDHALAAYNAGPGAVEKHGGVPPYAETRAYVRRVLAAKARFDRDNPAGA